jgi:plastocyanin
MRAVFLLLASVLCALALVACGDDDDDVPTQGPTPVITAKPVQVAEQPAPAQPLTGDFLEAQDGVIEMKASNLLFTQNYLRVTSAGQGVTIRLTNNDSVPHTLRFAGIDGRFNTDDDAIASPEQVDPGGVGELTFEPPVDGPYTFRCDIHPTTMGGQLIVGSATPGSAPPETSEASGSATPEPEVSFAPETSTETATP